MALADAGDRWDLGLKGAVVEQCCFDYAVTVRFRKGESAWELTLEAPFAVTTSDGTKHVIVPEEAAHLGTVLTTLRTTVESGTASKDGQLDLQLSNGTVMQAAPDEGFEAWTLTGPGGLQVVSLPGGQLATWSGSRGP
jgi:Family of unknown function (DUF6188)